MNDENLKPCTKENARERQLKSAEKRKENNAKKKLMSQIYAEFLEKEYNVRQGDKERNCFSDILGITNSARLYLFILSHKIFEGFYSIFCCLHICFYFSR